MGVMRAVCDDWINELRSVPELASATVHRYAIWSGNAINSAEPGLHLAVWPAGDPQVVQGATTDGTDQITTSYVIQVWERAPAETERVFDDDDANGAWLDLIETVKDRLYVRENFDIGDAGSDLAYDGFASDQAADVRVFAVRFSKRRYQQALP